MSKKRHANYLLGLFLFAASLSWAAAPDLEFHAPSSPTDAATAATLRDLATRLVPIYEEPDRDRYLANLFALQMVSGNYAAADVSRQSLRERGGSRTSIGRLTATSFTTSMPMPRLSRWRIKFHSPTVSRGRSMK